MRHIDQNVRHIDQNVNHFSCDNCTFTGDDGIELPITDWTTQTLGVRAIARDDPENLHRHHCTSHADRFLNSLFTPDNSSFFVFHASIYMIAFSEPHKSLFPPDESPGAAAKWFPFYSLQIFCQKLETQPIWCLSNKSDKPQYGIIHHTNYEWNLFSISKVELLV